MALRPNGLHHPGVEVLLMPLSVFQLLSSYRIHRKHYGSYSLMAAPTRIPCHQFFLEFCKAHRILAGFFQPPSSSKKNVCKVTSLGRINLLTGILCQFGAYLHTFYVGFVPPANPHIPAQNVWISQVKQVPNNCSLSPSYFGNIV